MVVQNIYPSSACSSSRPWFPTFPARKFSFVLAKNARGGAGQSHSSQPFLFRPGFSRGLCLVSDGNRLSHFSSRRRTHRFGAVRDASSTVDYRRRETPECCLSHSLRALATSS